MARAAFRLSVNDKLPSSVISLLRLEQADSEAAHQPARDDAAGSGNLRTRKSSRADDQGLYVCTDKPKPRCSVNKLVW
jgi:hypothetical protein